MRLIDADIISKQYNLEKATKYGNEDAEQQNFSYSTMMMYEIANMIDDAPTVDAIPISAIKDIKAEIRQGVSDFANENGDIAYGFACAEEIIDKHIESEGNNADSN